MDIVIPIAVYSGAITLFMSNLNCKSDNKQHNKTKVGSIWTIRISPITPPTTTNTTTTTYPDCQPLCVTACLPALNVSYFLAYFSTHGADCLCPIQLCSLVVWVVGFFCVCDCVFFFCSCWLDSMIVFCMYVGLPIWFAR